MSEKWLELKPGQHVQSSVYNNALDERIECRGVVVALEGSGSYVLIDFEMEGVKVRRSVHLAQLKIFDKVDEVPPTLLLPATCKCGRQAKSKRPDLYSCNACYYTRRALDRKEEARMLEEKAKYLRLAAEKDYEKAFAFAKKHPI
jgi:hypothetical protein